LDANFDPFATMYNQISFYVFNFVVTDLEFGVRTLRRLGPVLNGLKSSFFRHLRSPVLRPPARCMPYCDHDGSM
jgi:hypothetical protein